MTQAQQLADLSQAYTAGALGFRNRFINGDMRVWQRGNTGVIPINNPAIMAVDRWYGYTTGATATMRAGWQTPTGRLAMRMSADAAGNTGMAMGQRIESGNCWDLDNQLITVTAWVCSEGNTTGFGCNAYVYGAADNPSAGGGAWISGTPAPEVLAVSGTAPNAWYFIRQRIQLTANAHNGFAIEFGFPAVANGKSNALGDCQLERGYVATPFEQRPVGLELSLCQRYFYWASQVLFGGAAGVSGNGYFHTITHPTTMRTNNVGVTFANAIYQNANGPLNVNSVTATHLRASWSAPNSNTSYVIADIFAAAEL